MNENPYRAIAAEVASDHIKEPVVKKGTYFHILKKLFATLFFGAILAAFNLFAGTALGIGCTFSIGYIPDLFPVPLTFFVVGLFFLHASVITPVLALTICWKALSDKNPLAWCKKHWWAFLVAFALPFFIISYMVLAGAANA